MTESSSSGDDADDLDFEISSGEEDSEEDGVSAKITLQSADPQQTFLGRIASVNNVLKKAAEVII